ncbi:hypothetical protein J6590_029064 [Homalodisca vitripennis]|nr:hypothetical protein J6590_029064 [Homalodisca vitripennis]
MVTWLQAADLTETVLTRSSQLVSTDLTETLLTRSSQLVSTDLTETLLTRLSQLVSTDLTETLLTRLSQLVSTDLTETLLTRLSQLVSTDLTETLLTRSSQLVSTDLTETLLTRSSQLVSTDLTETLLTRLSQLVSTDLTETLLTRLSQLVSTDNNMTKVIVKYCVSFLLILLPVYGIPGGLSPANPNDPDVQDAARFAVSAVDQRSNSLFSSKLVVVKEAKTQVVAGTNYYLKLQLVETNCRKNAPTNSACRPTPDKVVQECDVVVYDRPWDKHRELTSVKCSPVSDNSARQQRRVMVGGLTPANPNDANVKEAANFAVSEVDRRSNSLFSSKLLVVKEAKTQVVAGVNYHLKLQLVESNCRKGSAVNSACSPAAGKVVQECDMVVYDRPWDKHRELISVRCSPVADNKVRNQRDVLVGGQSPADPNDAGVKKAAKFAVSEIDRRSNSLFSSKLVVVKEAKTQVVAGTNYYLKLQLVETNCRKGTKVNSACNAAPDKVIQECDVVVYDRPWDKHRELTSVTCSPISDNSVHRQQRFLLLAKDNSLLVSVYILRHSDDIGRDNMSAQYFCIEGEGEINNRGEELSPPPCVIFSTSYSHVFCNNRQYVHS